jgi:hypothetical protein
MGKRFKSAMNVWISSAESRFRFSPKRVQDLMPPERWDNHSVATSDPL